MTPGIESGAGWGTYLAYAGIVAFVALLVVVLLRTVWLYGLLLLMPVGRLLRRLTGAVPSPDSEAERD